MKSHQKYSSCCGYPATGEMIDLQICGDCKDHCTYDEFMDDDKEENDMMMAGYEPEEFENITGNERELSDDDFPLILDLP